MSQFTLIIHCALIRNSKLSILIAKPLRRDYFGTFYIKTRYQQEVQRRRLNNRLKTRNPT